MKQFIEWNSIEVKGNRVGHKRARCPLCSDSRKKKNDPCLSVDFNRGIAYCHNCFAVSFREEHKTVSNYTPPPQDWENHTNLSDNLVKYCVDRGIPQHVLMDFRITEERQWMPQSGKEQNCIVFNYFEGETLVNKKYRDGRKNFTQSKDGKRLLYNINAAIGQETVYIVEGEFDVLAMHANGYENTISLCNGANDHDDQWVNSEKYLADVKHFIIATDNDEKGIAVRDKIAHRLGKYRCSFVDWSDSKDANEAAKNGTLEINLRNAVRFPVSGTHTVSELKDGIFDLYNNGLPRTIKPKHRSFENVNKIFSTMIGHLVTVTGIPSSGKSNYVEWYVLNLVADHGFKASFFSPEHTPMSLHQTTFIQKAVGRNFWREYDGIPRVTETDINRYIEWANERIYITSPDMGDVATWDWLIDKFKEQLYSYGINIFVIDAFNKVQMPTGNRLEMINDVLTRLTAFAQTNDVLIILVAHPTKMKKKEGSDEYTIPTLYDVSGSADFRNQTHDGFTIHRHYGNDPCTEFVNMKTKYQFQGQIGQSAILEYDVPTGRYYDRGQNPPRFDMTLPMNEQTLTPLSDARQTAMKPNHTFDIDEIGEDEEVSPF